MTTLIICTITHETNTNLWQRRTSDHDGLVVLQQRRSRGHIHVQWLQVRNYFYLKRWRCRPHTLRMLGEPLLQLTSFFMQRVMLQLHNTIMNQVDKVNFVLLNQVPTAQNATCKSSAFTEQPHNSMQLWQYTNGDTCQDTVRSLHLSIHFVTLPRHRELTPHTMQNLSWLSIGTWNT